MHVSRNNESRLCSHCWRGKAISITYSECVLVALVIQHVMRMRPIKLLYVVASALPHFPHYLINGTIFGRKITEHEICVFIFSTTYVWNISHSKKKRASYDQKWTWNMFSFSLQLMSETFLILRRNERATIKNEHEICVFIFSTTYVWNISHSKKKWASYDQKWTWNMCFHFLSNLCLKHFSF
jgi:hypothetical protein